MPPLVARDLRARLDGRPVAATPAVSVPLLDRPRVLELSWRGGIEVEPPLAALEPGQTDRGLRVLELAEADGGLRLLVEGPAGGTGIVRLRGSGRLRAEGATLRRAGGATELEVALPASAGRFSRASIRLEASLTDP